MKKTEKISNKKELKRQIAEFWVPVNFLKLMGMDARPYTPLMTAVYNQDIDMVKYLLDKGANVNIKDKDGKTASSRTSNSEILKLLRKE